MGSGLYVLVMILLPWGKVGAQGTNKAGGRGFVGDQRRGENPPSLPLRR